MTRPRCVLVGPPGSGKTTVGRLVASALGVDLRDTDADIVAVTGTPVAEIFVSAGEEHFRALERDAVAVALAECAGVVALGGGAVLAPATRLLLREHTVIFLSVGLSEAVDRVGLSGGGRPLLAVAPRATMRYLLDQRRPLYEEVATHTVATDSRPPEQVADEVLALVGAAEG